MITKGSDIIGLKIFTVQEGKEIGQIKDIVYDPTQNKVRALLIDEGGWFSDAKVIPIENVENIGKDTIIVASESAIKKASDVPEPVANIARDGQHLTKTKIITEQGRDLGHISDIYFDSKSGILEEFEVSKGTVEDIRSGKKHIRVSDILTIGEDATIVKGFTEEKIEEQKGGIQGAAAGTKKGAENIMTKAKDSFQKLSQDIQSRIEETKESPKVQRTIDKTKQKTQEGATRIKRGAKNVKENIDEQKEKFQTQQQRYYPTAGSKGGKTRKNKKK